MRVMLTKDIDNVGKAGDIKEVADGYGRNFLFPRKLAVPAHRGAETEPFVSASPNVKGVKVGPRFPPRPPGTALPRRD